jgi:hypothetical protein
VNDLDLAIVDRAGRRHEILDRSNNHEQLTLSLPAGLYYIEVKAANVPVPQQSYALIVSAD